MNDRCKVQANSVCSLPAARICARFFNAAQRLISTFLMLAIVTTSSARGAAGNDLQSELATVRAAEAERVRVLKEAAAAVVCIFESPSQDNGGSGVLISPDGYGLTNFHVVAEFLESGGYGGLNDGRLYPLRVLGVDPGGDVAMFKLEGRERFPFALLGDSDALHVGQVVAALGNPFLLAEDFTPTLTLGVISGLHRYQAGQENALEYADCIQVSTSINPGNSGGPLFDMNGRVLGINGRASFEERGRVNVGLGYAITVRQIRRFIPGLRAGRTMLHGTLGATVRRAGNDLIFDAIQAASPVDKAGIELGDILVAIDGEPLRTGNEFNNAVATLPAHWPVTITYERDGKRHEALARLEPLPVALGAPIIPNPENNRTALEWQVRQFWRAHGQEPPPASTYEAVVYAVDLSSDKPIPPEDHRVAIAAARQAPASAATSGTGAASRVTAVFDEWRTVAALLLDADARAAAEVVGGDLVSGKIATVIEARLPDQRVARWYFDLDTSELLQATIGPDAGDTATWTIADKAAGGTPPLPKHWVRSAAGHTLDLMVRSISPRAEQRGPQQ